MENEITGFSAAFCILYNQEADNKVYLSVDVPRRGPASPSRSRDWWALAGSAVPKPRLARAAVISERPGACPPFRRVAGACAARSSSPVLSRPKPGRPERDAGTMFRRKLTALDYHNPAGFNCKGEAAARGRPRVVTPPAAPSSAPPPGLPTRTLRGLVSLGGSPGPSLPGHQARAFRPSCLASEPPHPLLPGHCHCVHLLNSNPPAHPLSTRVFTFSLSSSTPWLPG